MGTDAERAALDRVNRTYGGASGASGTEKSGEVHPLSEKNSG
jgi:hypothetical protein